MKGPRKELVVTQPLSDVEIFAILKEANQWERAMIVLLLGTGMRIGELAALRWEDVGEGVLLLHGKGNKQRMVAPGVAAMRELMRLPRESSHIFPFTRGAIMARLHRLARRSCPFHPHQFRHTYAHTLLRAGAGIEDLAEILGHVSIETTRTYLRAYRRERMLEAMVRWNPADALFNREAKFSPVAKSV
jgi:integrase